VGTKIICRILTLNILDMNCDGYYDQIQILICYPISSMEKIKLINGNENKMQYIMSYHPGYEQHSTLGSNTDINLLSDLIYAKTK